MLFARAYLNAAEHVKKQLVEHDLLDETVKVQRDDTFIYFPLTRQAQGMDYTCVERDAGRSVTRPTTLREALQDALSAEELEELIGSYDMVGGIAIVDIPERLQSKEHLIAKAVLDAHKHVTTVLKKAHKHSGEFRTQGLSYLAGEDTREAVVQESGCTLLVDVEQVYFSVRLSTERLRIAELVVPGERVLVLFSGAAPYVVILAKRSGAGHIVGVEKNPVGHEYGEANLRRNKIKRAELFNEDCADLSFLFSRPERFDRIIMPLPASSLDFVAEALTVAADSALLHIYYFGTEADLPLLSQKIVSICEGGGFAAEVVRVVRAGHHAPYIYRWCFDVAVKKIS